MKIFALIALLAVTGVASADTLALDTLPCGNAASGTCNVYDDGGSVMQLYWNANGTVRLTGYTRDDNNVLSAGQTYATNLGTNPTNGINGAVLADPLGAAVTLTGTFQVQRILIRSGHNYYVWRTRFLGGSIVN